MTAARKRSYPSLDLHGAFLRRTDLTDAVLVGANLARADLSNADLRGADLSDAVLSGTVLRGADLRDTKNLTAAQLRQAIIDDDTRLPSHLAVELRMPLAGD